jgi:hypothetical protein
MGSGMTSIVGAVLNTGEQARKKLRDREDLRGIGEVDEIKKCPAVLSPPFIGRGEHGGLDTTTAMVKRWRSLEALVWR